MLEMQFDEKDGKCVGVLEWTLADKNGKVTNGGEYLYIYELWCWKRNGCIPKFIKTIYKKAPTAKYAYWKRRKYKGRAKCFTREQFLKWANG